MRNIIVLFALSIAACGVDQPEPQSMGSGSGSDHGAPADAFVGAYHTTITLSGTSSQTYTDSMTILAGTTSDLILQSQQLGSIKAKIISGSAFSIDQQQITLTDANNQAFSVTMQGQGTVTGGVFNASGQLSSSNGALAFTIAGARL